MPNVRRDFIGMGLKEGLPEWSTSLNRGANLPSIRCG